MYNPSMLRVVTGLMIAAFFVASANGVATAEADEMLAQLSKIRLDKKQIFSVRDISIRRDVLSISFNRGAIAFTEPVDGKVTGAVFVGNGDILANPPGRSEKQQLHRFTKSAILSEHFETMVLRFTDETYEEILKEYKTHAVEDVDPDQMEQLLRWDAELQRRSRFLNSRVLSDLLGASKAPFFLAQVEGEQLGWFDAVYDERRDEEVFIGQRVANAPLTWASFNKRSEARDPEAFAREDKTLTEFLGYSVDGPTATLRLRARVGGERVIEFPLVPGGSVLGVSSDESKSIPYIENMDHVAVILAEPTRRGQEITLRITYSTEAPRTLGLRRNDPNSIRAAGYRDQWIIDGLNAYSMASSGNALEAARAQLLVASPEGGSYESLAPVSLGYRMTQPRTTDGYANALRNKSVWIMHMLRNLLRKGEDDETTFSQLIADLTEQYSGKTLTTYDFKRLAESRSGLSLDWFFDEWVFETGVPAYSVDYKIDPVSGGFAIEGKLSQTGVPETFEMPIPLYADESFLGMVKVSADEGAFRFVVKNRPQQLRIDPKSTVLMRLP